MSNAAEFAKLLLAVGAILVLVGMAIGPLWWDR